MRLLVTVALMVSALLAVGEWSDRRALREARAHALPLLTRYVQEEDPHDSERVDQAWWTVYGYPRDYIGQPKSVPEWALVPFCVDDGWADAMEIDCTPEGRANRERAYQEWVEYAITRGVR